MGERELECGASRGILAQSSEGPRILVRKDAAIPKASMCHEDRTSYRWRSIGRRVFLEWRLEIGSLVVSILTLVAIIVTLLKQDGKVLLSLPSRINLNSLIAILTTVLRVTIVVVVGEEFTVVIAQLKWHWLGQPQFLGQLNAFYEASQGPWGSFMFLFRSKTPYLAMFGCLVTVVSVSLGPFVQQSIKNVACNQPVPGLTVSIPAATVIPPHGYALDLNGSYDYSYAMQVALINGFLYPEKANSGVPFTCPTGNCTFPSYNNISYTSLGVCSVCFNTTSLISEEVIVSYDSQGVELSIYNYSLPNGMAITSLKGSSSSGSPKSLQVGTGILDWAGPLLTPELRSIFEASITNVSFLTFTLESCSFRGGAFDRPHEGLNLTWFPVEWDVVAASCTLYGCLRSYFTEVNLGLVTERLISTVPMTPLGRGISTIPATPEGTGIRTIAASTMPTITPLPQTDKRPGSKISLGLETWVALKIPCVLNGVGYDLGNFSAIPSSEKYNLISVVFSRGNITKIPQDCLYRTPDVYFAEMQGFMDQVMNRNCGPYQPTVCGSLWWLQRLSSDQVSFAIINDTMNGVSTCATNQLRLIGRDGGGFQPGIVNGTAYQTLVCTQFDGFWLVLPSLLVVIGAILLSVMMVKTAFHEQNIPPWKSSVLPLLFHGPFLKQARRLTRLMSLGEMEKEANKIAVRLHSSGNECGLVGPEMESSDEDIGSRPVEVLSQTQRLQRSLTL